MATNHNELPTPPAVTLLDGRQLAKPSRQNVTSPLSPAQRKARQRERERAAVRMYARDDWQLFLDLGTLPQKAGCQRDQLPYLVLKELVDNALDADAAVTVTYIAPSPDERESSRLGGEYVVSDDGPGLSPPQVAQLFSVNRPMVSSKLLRRPLRGMLGNGLRVVAAAVAASNGQIVVETRGHRLSLHVDDVTGYTTVSLDEPIAKRPGLTVRIRLGQGCHFRGVEHEFMEDAVRIANRGRLYKGKSSPYWYSAKDLRKLFQFVATPNTTVGAIAADLGVEIDDDRCAKILSEEDSAFLLAVLKGKAQQVYPELIGRIGESAFPETHYGRKVGFVKFGGAELPFAVEAWVSCRPTERSYSRAEVDLYINRSPSIASIHALVGKDALQLSGCGLVYTAAKIGTGAKADYKIIFNLTTPWLVLTNDGKAPDLTPFKGAIVEAVGRAATAAHRALAKPPGPVMSIKEAAYSVMVAAYLKASDNNRLPANARQCMYAARPAILRKTGVKGFGDAYFTQTLLPDFIDEHPGRTADWDVVYDARGSFTEPHTDCAIPIGTLEIREYLGLRPKLGPAIEVRTNSLFPTLGPKNRYRAVLFVEKEGFDPLFRAAGIAERFDVAIMSTKGMSVVAARSLLDQISPDIDKVLVLHDFDVSGFSIFGTLGSDGRRYVYENRVPIIDIGLRLTDVERMGLDSEPVKVNNWQARSATLERHGATAAEIAFLADRRVELNAMTSRQFVNFVEQKLIENGVTKVIPDAEVVYAHARRLIEQKLGEEAIDKIRVKLAQEAASTVLPEDLCEQLNAEIERNPSRSWDAALANLIAAGPA
jgi:hypothetical protein